MEKIMHILFYMDPFVDYLDKGGTRSFVLRYDMMPSLLAYQFGDEASVKVFCHEKLLETNNVREILRKIAPETLTDTNITEILKNSELSAEDIVKGKSNEKFLSNFRRLLSILGETWTPDIIIGWGIIPEYLNLIYPQAIILEAEHSALFRIYNEADTFYFPRNDAIRKKLFNYIKSLKLTQEDENLLAAIKTELEILANPLGALNRRYFSEGLEEKKIIFYPGHFSSPYALRFSKYMGDEEVLSNILKHASPNAIILYLKHPLSKNTPSIVRLSDKIIDISYLAEFDDQITLKAILLCDIFINSHSKTSFLALLMNKPVIEIDNFYYSDFCLKDINVLSSILSGQTYPIELRIIQKKLIYFMLTHTISQRLLQCEETYKDFLLNIYNVYSDGKFEKLFAPATLYEVYEKIHNSSYLSSKKIERVPTTYDKIKACILSSKYKNICFDIFDTLLWRPFNRPTDMFYMMSNEVSKILHSERFDFFSARISAEWHARRKCANGEAEDVTLEDIYSSFAFLFGVSHAICQKISGIEKDYEKRFIQCRKSAKNLVNLALISGKKIYAVSDMYLSSIDISHMLVKVGYPCFNKVIVSCEEKSMKSTGTLFKVLKNRYGIDPSRSLFIGDSIHSDVNKPIEFGYRAFHYPSGLQCIKEKTNFAHFYSTMLTHSVSAHFAVMANVIFDNPYAPFDKKTMFNNSSYLMGFLSIGPFLVNFTGWLTENLKFKQYGVILFCSRDCYLIEKIYKLYRKHFGELPQGKYFYISRQSILPCFKNINNIALLPSKYNSRYNALDFLERYFNLDRKNSVIKKHRRYLKHIGENRIELTKLQDFLRTSIQIDEQALADEQNIIRDYVLQETSGKNFAMVDSGARGTTRDAISDLLGTQVDLYLLRSYRYKRSDENQTIAYHKESFNYFRPGRQAFTSAFYEPLISCCHEGSCEGYKQKGEHIVPIFEEKEPTKIHYHISHAQRGALDFANYYFEIFEKDAKSMILEPSSEIFKAPLEFVHARMSDSNFFETFFYQKDPLNSERDLPLLMPPLQKSDKKLNVGSKKCAQIDLTTTHFPPRKKRLLQLEKFIFMRILSGRKRIKYIQNRRAFFLDSRKKFLHIWYNYLNR